MIRLRYASVNYTPDGCVSHFADGTSWGAQPHATPHYHVIAHRCGYEDDLLAYCREHEVCHHLAAEWLMNAPSPIIWALAHGAEVEPGAAALEEFAVQGLQRFLRAGERPIIGGIDWDGLRRHALACLASQRSASS